MTENSNKNPGDGWPAASFRPAAEARADARPFSLEKRTWEFARRVRLFVKTLPRTLGNFQDAKQVTNSSGSVGANHIEANDALSKRDFLLRIKICRKEAKESRYWLTLIETGENPEVARERDGLVAEAGELLKILSSIVVKSQ